MSYRFAIVSEYSPWFLMKKVRDLCVEAGWEDVTPAGGEPKLIGYFLKSTGESGNENLNILLWRGSTRNYSLSTYSYHVWTGFLSADITADAATIPLQSASNFPSAGGVILIDDELIVYTGVSGNNLTGCTRGYLYSPTGNPPPSNSPAQPHSSGAVVQLIYNLADTTYYYEQLFCEIFLARDLETPLHSPSSVNVTATSATFIAINDGIRDIGSYFNLHSLLRLGTSPNYKWRWVETHSFATPTHTLGFSKVPFRTAETSSGITEAAIISGGFLPGYSRRNMDWSNTCAGIVAHARVTATNLPGTSTPRTYFIYVSKDYVWIVCRVGNEYCPFFVGRCVPPQSTARDTLSTNPTIEVCNFSSSGYTPCVYTDIGKNVRDASLVYGKLWHYDNTSRIWYVQRDDNLHARINSGTVLYVHTGAGQGTTSAHGTNLGFMTGNVDFYAPNKKLRILTQNFVGDHLIPRNLKVTDWAPLDPEETPSEEFVVAYRIPRNVILRFKAEGYTPLTTGDLGKTVTGSPSGDTGILSAFDNTERVWWVYPNFNRENLFRKDTQATVEGKTSFIDSVSYTSYGVVKIEHPAYYTYRSGVVGDHPFPYVRTASYSTYNSQHYFVTCYLWSAGADIHAHASHRQRYRAFHSSSNKYVPMTSSITTSVLQRYAFFSRLYFDNLSNGIVPALGTLEITSPSTSYGIYQASAGVLPNVMFVDSGLVGGVSPEDYYLMFVDGSYKKYRYFYVSSVAGGELWHYFLGPEEW